MAMTGSGFRDGTQFTARYSGTAATKPKPFRHGASITPWCPPCAMFSPPLCCPHICTAPNFFWERLARNQQPRCASTAFAMMLARLRCSGFRGRRKGRGSSASSSCSSISKTLIDKAVSLAGSIRGRAPPKHWSDPFEQVQEFSVQSFHGSPHLRDLAGADVFDPPVEACMGARGQSDLLILSRSFPFAPFRVYQAIALIVRSIKTVAQVLDVITEWLIGCDMEEKRTQDIESRPEI